MEEIILKNNFVIAAPEGQETVFQQVFKHTTYFSDLYEHCTGRRLNEDNICFWDISAQITQRIEQFQGSGIIGDGRYSGVAFVIDESKIIIIIECQDTIDPHIPALMIPLRNDAKNQYDEISEDDLSFEWYAVYGGEKKLSASSGNIGGFGGSLDVSIADPPGQTYRVRAGKRCW